MPQSICKKKVLDCFQWFYLFLFIEGKFSPIVGFTGLNRSTNRLCHSEKLIVNSFSTKGKYFEEGTYIFDTTSATYILSSFYLKASFSWS